MEPVLQIALDYLDLDRALDAAKDAVRGGVDWLEAGTPLIKSEGLKSVKALHKEFPGKKIVADMKIMDTGRLEVEAAAKSGASIVTVLAAADDSTIIEAVEAARNMGCEIMIDLISVEDPVKRAIEVETMGAHYVCVHLSIDQQMKGEGIFSTLEKVSKNVSIPVACAGGITSDNAPSAVSHGASVIVVGGAITKSEDRAKAAKTIKESIRSGKSAGKGLYKRYSDPLEAFARVSAANISDAMHRRGSIEGVKDLTGRKVVGTAYTVRTYPGDWAKPVEAIDAAEPGDVIVIDAGGCGKAVWGELATQSCITKKIAGVVIYGSARDIEDIMKLDFPLFAKSVIPTAGEPEGLGELNIPIKCGNVLIRPGDYVIGDPDGVVIVPRERATEIANRALDVLEKEIRWREEIKSGSSLSEAAKVKKWERFCCGIDTKK